MDWAEGNPQIRQSSRALFVMNQEALGWAAFSIVSIVMHQYLCTQSTLIHCVFSTTYELFGLSGCVVVGKLVQVVLV